MKCEISLLSTTALSNVGNRFVHNLKFRFKQKKKLNDLVIVCFKKVKFSATQAPFIWKKDGALNVFDRNNNK